MTAKDGQQSLSVFSTSNYMGIYYISTGGHRGMRAKYTAVAPAREYFQQAIWITFVCYCHWIIFKLNFNILVACGRESDSWEDTFTSPDLSSRNESTFYCNWFIKQPEMSEENLNLTLSITISGIVNRGRGSITCRNYLSYIMIKGKKQTHMIMSK